MDLATIRKQVIIAMFSDDALMEQLVLKGGNAVSLVHRLGSRSSLDLDFSLEGDFFDLESTKQRIFSSLKDRFGALGLAVFDERFSRRPEAPQPPRNDRHTGYEVAFKLIPIPGYGKTPADLLRMRREALVIGEAQERAFHIHISKFEHCAGKVEQELDDYAIYVYTPAMLAIEKLRAICQQMPEYQARAYPAARARDFYDIHAIVMEAGVDLASPDNLNLARNIFAAKEVPLRLIPLIPDQKEFHRPDWPSVELTVSGGVRDFDFYADFLAEQVRLLEPLWKE